MIKRTQLQTIPSFTESSNIRYYLNITNRDRDGGKESNGKQIYDNSDGSYLPDRKVNPLVFQHVVRLEDPNLLASDGKATIGNARITSVMWYTSDGKYDTSGKPILTEISNVAGKTEITADMSTGVFKLESDQLVVSLVTPETKPKEVVNLDKLREDFPEIVAAYTEVQPAEARAPYVKITIRR